MKAISLWQPWASLIACGVKSYETRDWAPPRSLVGQTIAIHAAKKIDKELGSWVDSMVYGQDAVVGDKLSNHLDASEELDDRFWGRFGEGSALPIGVVVCTATLDAAFQLGDVTIGTPARRLVVNRIVSHPARSDQIVDIDDFGDYAYGRWAWRLTNVSALYPPVPMVGRQGFFDLPQGWIVP